MKSILNRISTYLKQRKLRKAAIKSTLNRVTGEYEHLINEFRLIQEKKSMLSKRERDFIEQRIKHLISKGHIQVNK